MIGPSRVAELDMPAAGVETGAGRPAQSYWNESWERLRANRLGVATGALIVVLALIAVLAPAFSAVVTHYQPQTIDLDSTFARPGAGHLLGSDELGRDTLTRLIWGARVSLGVAFLTVAMSLFLGTTVGMMAGYYGGWIDDVLMRLVDTVLAIPAIFLFILMSILIRPNAITLAAIVASVGWGQVARLVRGEVLSQDYIRTARAKGMSERRVVYLHGLRNALIPLITLIGLELPGLVSGGLVVEVVFGWPGIGKLAFERALQYDYTTVMGVTFFATLLVIAGNLLADLLYGVLDPRIRYG